MKRKFVTSARSVVAILSALVILAATVLAGPPLVCHPINIGSAQSLPWTSATWHLSGDETYDISHLVSDTLALLTPNSPVLVRMETIRRAVLYSKKNSTVSQELLSKLESRASNNERDPFAAFDFGYLIETYRQADLALRMSHTGTTRDMSANPAAGLDGYPWVKKAISMRGEDPAMEFAAALITTENSKQDYQGHVQKARAAANQDPLLAQNIATHF